MIITPNRIDSQDGIRKLQDGNDSLNFSLYIIYHPNRILMNYDK